MEISRGYPITRIKKRDGRYEDFDASKITEALKKAGEDTGEYGENISRFLTIRVLNLVEEMFRGDPPTVEDVQDIVEDVLITSPYKKTAKSYIIYREQHAQLRNIVERADVKLIDDYIEKLDWKVRENSNMAYSLQGLNNYISSEISRVYWLNKIYTPEIREAHRKGDIHIHDLGQISVYCVGWDLYDLLASGFTGAMGKTESRPPKHFRPALGQVVNFFYTLQGEAAGAQAFSSLDTLLAPYIRYDNLTYKEVKQAMQEFIYNINVPTRVGFQTPFTNVTLDLEPAAVFRDQNVVIGGELMPEKYGEFQHEMNMFNKAFVEVLTEGDARGRVFTFPIPTYNITKDFNWDRPELESLWEATAKYGIPYFANFVNSDMSPDDARSMCCRLRLDLRSLEKRGGGLFGSNPLTGSIGVVTMNMPRIGYLSETEDEFLARLDRLMTLARKSLEVKRRVLEGFTEKGLYPYTKFYLRSVKERFGRYWANHFSTIGLVGMNEASLNLLGKDIGTEEGEAFAVRVMDHMREKLAEFQEETGNYYNLEATPAEGTSFRLARLDRTKYPEIITANNADRDRPFYTNSTQLPVNYSTDVFKVLDMQEQLQSRYTGGTVLHIFLGEAVNDTRSVKAFVKRVAETYSLPYFTLSPTFSICPTHGYLKGEQPQCPECGAETEVFSRVVGYLRPINQWNDGKQAEYKERREFQIQGE